MDTGEAGRMRSPAFVGADATPAPQGQLYYGRHAILLAACTALLGFMSRWRISAISDLSFCAYGVLHATALAASLRARCPWWRRLAFILAAALACDAAARLGYTVYRLTAWYPLGARPSALVLASLCGALAYGFLLCNLLGFRIPLASLATVAVICAVAAPAASVIGGFGFGGLSAVAGWWAAFSGCLWLLDRRRERISE